MVIKITVKLGELPEESYVKRSSDKKEDIKLESLGFSIKSKKDNKGIIVSEIFNEINLVSGDEILEVNREKVQSIEEFISLVDKIKTTGRTSLLLKINRDNKSLWATIKFKN